MKNELLLYDASADVATTGPMPRVLRVAFILLSFLLQFDRSAHIDGQGY